MQKHNETGRHSFLMGPGSGLGSGGQMVVLSSRRYGMPARIPRAERGIRRKKIFQGESNMWANIWR